MSWGSREVGRWEGEDPGEVVRFVYVATALGTGTSVLDPRNCEKPPPRVAPLLAGPGFLKAGIGIAGVDLGEVRGSPASTAEFTKFYDEMVGRGWSAKPILLGQSRGGLMMLAWAVRHPDKVRAFVGIYPVCNLGDWPMRNPKTVAADYGLPEADVRARMAEFNPVDNLGGLLKHKVSVFVVHGDADVVVPYETNTRLLKERYEAGGGPIEVKWVPGEGHQEVPAFFECRELVAFVRKQAKGP